MSKDPEVVVMPLTELRKLTEAIERVRELHKPDSHGACLGCADRCGCSEGDWADQNTWETCPTIKALEGEQTWGSIKNGN